MMRNEKRQARDWFHAAARCYVEKHQACASCGEQYCVLRSEWGSRIEYHCSACDFSVSHDSVSGLSFMAAGDGVGLACQTQPVD
jgi:hypothetical protein